MTRPTITEIFPLTDDADGALMIDLHNAVWSELIEHRTPNSVEELRARWIRPKLKFRFWVALGRGEKVVGLMSTVQWTDGTNSHFQFVQILVDRAFRRQGIGTQLLRVSRDVAIESGRTTLSFDAFDSVPAGHAFSRAIGAEVGMREYVNVVDVVDIDRSMLERWATEGPSRAPEYEMLVFDDGYPEDLFEEVADLWHMADEDMPFEDLDMEPSTASAEEVAQILDRNKHLLERITGMPRHIESGRLVGFSELLRRHSDHANLQTTLTMVHRDHRGHALGKWVKAAVILRGLDRWPEGVRIKTENAQSNDAMLGINNAIGFKPSGSMVSYQTTVDVLDRYLNGR